MEKLSQDLIACLLAGMIGFQIYALTVIVMRLPKQQKSTMALLMAFGILSSLMELIGLVTGIDELYSLLCKIVSCLSVLLVIYGQWHILHLVSSLSTFWTSRNITITQTLLMAVGLCCFWRVFDSPLSWIGDGALLLSLATPNTLSTHYMLHWIEKEVRSDPSFASLAAERRTNVKKVCRYLWILVILILATVSEQWTLSLLPVRVCLENTSLCFLSLLMVQIRDCLSSRSEESLFSKHSFKMVINPPSL